jgi:xanthine dehydrogenase accessory factor
LHPSTLTELLKAQSERRGIVFAKRLTDGAEFILPDPAAPAALSAAGDAALRSEKAGTQNIDGEDWFIEPRLAAPRLLIVGAVHIAQALAPLGAMAGFDVTVVDPRTAYANAERFPGVAIIHEWPDAALAQLLPDARTAIVTLSHDPKLDDPALDIALRSPAFYIGALGSRKTHAARLERLRAMGHDAELTRINGPAGLPIGAVTTGEIALSIMAQITAIRRSADSKKAVLF